MDPLDHSSSSNNISTNTASNNAQHYLAEIKYPTIPEAISIDKIFNVLQKIRTTSRPLFYKWQSLNKPKHGEIYLEQKYPLTRDPVAGDQFSIVDDGYLWSSIPKPEIREYLNQQIEVFRWTEGFSPGDRFFSMSKTEYRLKVPNNILFLIHYLAIKEPNVPVRTALPATKISPLYLQQQFFSQLKQQMAQMVQVSRRSPSPVVRPPVSKGQPGQRPPPSAVSATTATSQAPVNPSTAVIESSIDIFDSFSDYEAAQYRLAVAKPLLHRLLEASTQPPAPKKVARLSEGLEDDLIAAIKKSISTNQDRANALKESFLASIKKFKADQLEFWKIYRQLQEEIDMDTTIYKYLLEVEEQGEQEDLMSYVSL